jgi:hypothetical protein
MSLRVLALALAALAIPMIVRAQESGPTTHSDSIALAITIYSVALSNGTQTAHDAPGVELVCVRGSRAATDPAPEVIAARNSSGLVA